MIKLEPEFDSIDAKEMAEGQYDIVRKRNQQSQEGKPLGKPINFTTLHKINHHSGYTGNIGSC